MYNSHKSNYINRNIEYIFGDIIIEYDMRDAGMSIITEYKLLPDNKIDDLRAMNKNDRNIKVGLMQRDDKEFSKKLNNHFTLCREMFIASNNIEPNRILSVKKDAIYVIGDKCTRCKFNNIVFVAKNSYTSYIRLPEINNIELYYNDGNIDIKGMNDSAVNKHRLYLISFIIDMIELIEIKNKFVKRKIIKFINSYKSGELDNEYYVEFNNVSKSMNPDLNYIGVIIPILNMIMREV